jgi:hypothetical protein
MRYFKLIALTLFLFGLSLTFSANSSHALSFDLILDPTLLTQKDALLGVSLSDLAVQMEAIYGVNLGNGEIAEDQTYALDRETSEITFGDGLRGSIPPTGTGGTAAAYRWEVDRRGS